MPSPDPIEKRFIFHGNAVAFAAHFRRPTEYQFRAVASSSLPVSGGLAEASSKGQSFTEPKTLSTVSFTSASTTAIGDFDDLAKAAEFTHGNHGRNDLKAHTFVESKLSGLNISIVQDKPAGAAGKTISVKVKELRAQLSSSSDRVTPVSFRGLDAQILGVTVNDQELIVSTATQVFTECHTHDLLVQRFEKDKDFRKKFGSLFYPTGTDQSQIANSSGLIAGTVVSGLKWAKKAPTSLKAGLSANRLTIEGVGSIYFGEIVIQRNARRLSLLRFQLGSPVGADGTVCETDSNGQFWPPQ